MNVTLMGSAHSRPRAATLAGGFANMFNSANNGDRTYTAQRASTLDFVREKRPMPFDTLAVMALAQPYTSRVDASNTFHGTAAEIKALETKLVQVQKANEEFEREVTTYYDARVSRTSGGKRARLRDERAILIRESTKARQTADAAIRDLRSLVVAQIKSEMRTDPDSIVATANPESGRIEYRAVAAQANTSAATRDPAQSSAAGKVPMSLLLIPVGLAAAYFLAKG